MTTIVGVNHNDHIELVADSQISVGAMRWGGIKNRSGKIFEVNDMIVGGSGVLSEITLLHMFAKTHSIGEGGLDKVMEWMLEFSDWAKKKANIDSLTNTYLIGHRSGLYNVNEITPELIDTYEAIGSGWKYAYTALHLQHSAERAVEIACELDNFSGDPITRLTLKK